jgi:phthalate 4,5-dioxygenase oxygenase subunit
MLTPEENDLLCRVEGDAPMGQLMRRHWFPACLSEELPEPDGAPVPVRLLGEDLVAWRDSDGRVGLMARLCPHRKASLVYGRNEAHGLRCLYHGWKFDVHGQAVEMPSEPAQSALMDKVRIKAYPTHEHGGVVWTYMGPPQGMPPRDGLHVGQAVGERARGPEAGGHHPAAVPIHVAPGPLLRDVRRHRGREAL